MSANKKNPSKPVQQDKQSEASTSKPKIQNKALIPLKKNISPKQISNTKDRLLKVETPSRSSGAKHHQKKRYNLMPNSNNVTIQLKSRAYLLLMADQSPDLQALLLAQCKRDIHFWFDHFCWTFDPREESAELPFQLYGFQHDALDHICHAIETGSDILIEKSRDMGVSWLILLTFQYYWLFREGVNFHCGSRKQELVDRKGDRSTLMEKIRFNLKRLPEWMKPEQFRISSDDNLLKIINPDNSNTITGESSNEHFARGGRYTAILFDEFPFWPFQDAAFAAAGQSSPCRIVVGTPYGNQNRFAVLRNSGKTNVLTIHWRLHPKRDDAWYTEQCQRMTEEEVARELDINYSLSVKNRVFTQFNDQHKRSIQPVNDKPIIRSWDFGYHCPACVFIQLDSEDRILVLEEVIGQCDLAIDFAQRVLDISQNRYLNATFQDVCDPAGAQRSDKNLLTSIEILNSLKIYPQYRRSLIKDGIEMIRMKLKVQEDGQPAFLIHPTCTRLIEAFEGAYRFRDDTETPIQEHPYEDVMDCLRYAVMAKCRFVRHSKRKALSYTPLNRYTGY